MPAVVCTELTEQNAGLTRCSLKRCEGKYVGTGHCCQCGHF